MRWRPDIGTNGCRVPVSICDDLLLDGRNRALADAGPGGWGRPEVNRFQVLV